MTTLTIFPDTSQIPRMPRTLTYDYIFSTRFDSHYAQLSLDISGKYLLRVDGKFNSIYEESAKRNPNYRIGKASLAKQMLTDFNNCDAVYRDIYKHTPQLAIGSYKECEMADVAKKKDTEIEVEADKIISKPDLANIELKKYKREKFNIKKPSMTEVEDNLHNEANHRFFSFWKKNSSNKEQYVYDNKDIVLKDRLDKYSDLKDYFEIIQDTLARKADEEYLNEYNSKRNNAVSEYNTKRKNCIDDLKRRRNIAKDYINGPKSYVQECIKNLKNKSHLPFKIQLVTNYTQKDGWLDVEMSIPESIPILMSKAISLASGRICIKNKLERETCQDLVFCQLGVAYYICGLLFNISSNIRTICCSLMANDCGDGFYWVQFLRGQFFSYDFTGIDPLLTMEKFPHVIKKGNNTLEPINAIEFKAKINDALIIARQASNSNQHILPMNDAQRILNAMPNASDLREAINAAKSNGYSVVIADKKYMNLLKEL